jgi:hypothetical protein
MTHTEKTPLQIAEDLREYAQGCIDHKKNIYRKGRSRDYKKGWKDSESIYLVGDCSKSNEIKLPIINPDGKYHIQTGYLAGSYKERYTLESQIQACRYYDSLLIHSGYKKRLIGPDGTLEERYISSKY